MLGSRKGVGVYNMETWQGLLDEWTSVIVRESLGRRGRVGSSQIEPMMVGNESTALRGLLRETMNASTEEGRCWREVGCVRVVLHWAGLRGDGR